MTTKTDENGNVIPDVEKPEGDKDTTDKTDDKSADLDVSTPEAIAATVEKLVNERLAPIKTKLDEAYSARDTAIATAQEKEDAARTAELALLRSEGKDKEAHELELAESKKTNEKLQEQNRKLSRDSKVRESMNALTFRNAKAADLAFKEVVGELVQGEDGQWKHKSGVSIGEYVTAFASDETQSFLFKPKSSSGADLGDDTTTETPQTPKSLFDMKQEDVIKMAGEGKLPGQK